jgi:molybdenum cofactor sulfurtransferase
LQPAIQDTKREPSSEEVEASFRRAYPAYAGTGALDDLRRSDFARLNRGGHVYLDHTGAGLYADSQLAEHFELFSGFVGAYPPATIGTFLDELLAEEAAA